MSFDRTRTIVTRQDMVDAAVDMIRPLVRCLTPGKARLLVSAGSAHYSEDVAGMEGFSRVLWALVPMLAGRCPEAEEFWPLWREGLISGTDPEGPEYWGDIRPFDQRMVEMASIASGLCFVPDRFYGELSPAEQDRLIAWLDQINRYDMPKNNWRFFRILVNIGFMTVGRPVDENRLKEDLDMMESHYVGDGWYFDYETKRDYYTLWGFHFYSLLYAAAMRDRDPERVKRFEERACLIAPRFACWFDSLGRGLPYGRSLTYRFAQGSFFSALALADLTAPGLDFGQMKRLILSNLSQWLAQPIFDRDGVLTVGYGYPNLCMAEGYNAPGSPYWGMKTFFALALPESHPFWQAEARPFDAPRKFLDEQVRLLITRDKENRHVIAYTAGNHGWEHMCEDAKYEKFAYSTHFGFSVAKEANTLSKGAYDSMLAVKRAGKDLWHVRSGCERFSLTEDRVDCVWSPMEGVTVETTVAPCGMWHVRRHVIRAVMPIQIAEGAFAVRKDWPAARPADREATICREGEDLAMASGAYGTSAIFALSGYDAGHVISAEPNTNLIWPRTVLPMLNADLPAGVSTLLCAVYTATEERPVDTIPKEVMSLAESL